MEFEEDRGYLWPANTRAEVKDLIAGTVDDLNEAVELVRKRRVVVQAGGNVGCWPRWLASRFETVYTFEPDFRNFAALARNVTSPHVYKFQAALGDRHGGVGLRQSPKNIGAHAVRGDGTVPMLRIDDLALTCCDLIVLDIEGYEFPALRGAERTIRAGSPVIMIEDRGLGDKGWGGGSFASTSQWLGSLGYAETKRVHYDVIFQRRRPSWARPVVTMPRLSTSK